MSQSLVGVNIDSLSAEQVAQLYAQVEMDPTTLEAIKSQVRAQFMPDMEDSDELSQDQKEQALARFELVVVTWANQLMADVGLAAANYYSTEDLRAYLRFDQQNPGLRAKSANFALQKGGLVMESLLSLGVAYQQAMDELDAEFFGDEEADDSADMDTVDAIQSQGA